MFHSSSLKRMCQNCLSTLRVSHHGLPSSEFKVWFSLRVEKAENNCFDHVALMLLCKVQSGGKPVTFFFIQHNQSNPKITQRVVINCTSCAFDAVRVKYRSWSSVSVFVASTQVQNRLCSISAKMALYFLLFLRILWQPVAVCTTISSLFNASRKRARNS